jgi:hypothetical protein
MPYFSCPRCRHTVYSAAASSTCPGCSGRLRRDDRVYVRQDLAQPISRSPLSRPVAGTASPAGEPMGADGEGAGNGNHRPVHPASSL